ncbi:hypothetical protein AAFC00_001740 [Neodothiora populina]|uniref:PhoD-like phosphatase domain-containing protein n=1 Tax=Neodothiora populina TaxID=2781224 RepID=A0ABR3PPZ3_9PEZI
MGVQDSGNAYMRSDSHHYDADQPDVDQIAPSNRRQSFSARAGREAAQVRPHHVDSADAMNNNSAAVRRFKKTRQPYPLDTSQGQPASSYPSSARNQTLDPPDHILRAHDSESRSPLSPLSGSNPRAREARRRSSVPDRSPLQKLEGTLDDISKEEKRARMEKAEHRARERRLERATAEANQSRRMDHQVRTPMDSSKVKHRPPQDSQYAPLEGPISSSTQVPAGQDPRIVDANHRFRRASDALRMQNRGTAADEVEPRAQEPAGVPPQTVNKSGTYDGSRGVPSANYHQIGRGGSIAQSAVMPSRSGVVNDNSRKSLEHSEATVDRSTSRRLQKRLLPETHTSQSTHGRNHASPSNVHPDYKNLTNSDESAGMHEGFSPVARHALPAADPRGHTHHVSSPHPAISQGHMRKEASHPREMLNNLRRAGIAKLTLEDLAIDDTYKSSRNSAWRNSNRGNGTASYDGSYKEEAKSFRPPLLLKCGPLLRYTGLRQEAAANPARSSNREIWRGSVMIVTADNRSSYEAVPTLRLFSQPMDLLAPLPTSAKDPSQELPLDYDDPIAGQIKVSRIGNPLFVKPVDYIDEGADLSRIEDDSGLFTVNQLQDDISQGNSPADSAANRKRSRIRPTDGEKVGKFQEVKAACLHAEQGTTFWRFNLEIELGSTQRRVAYRINNGPAIGFWVPAKGESMNIMFHSCNGFSLSVDPNVFSGPDPLWRDVLNKHQSKPFHVMLGGGDQIYNDAAMRDTELFKKWTEMKNPERKRHADFTEAMHDELQAFYLNRYCMWFSQGLFGLANSQIPMVNIWDDHDIIDGYGSYPHHFMSTKVFTGLGAVAFKYYLLFQHQSIAAETQREEPSWLLGASPGPYIHDFSRSIFMNLGRSVAFLGLDCRTERMRDEILSQESYDIIFDRCRRDIIKGETKHLVVLLGVPIAYPRLNFLENILTSRVMDPIKAIGRTGILGGFVNKFDGGVELLDDLDDHWTAKHHKSERNWFIQELQELAAEKSVRVTILGGDVHLAAVGQFYSNKKLGIPKDRDHRYMPNIISSAIVNTPPPNLMGDVLNKRNKIHHLDVETDEDMIPMFEEDVDGKPRNNLHLLPRRNYCTICEYIPGSSPPPTPDATARRPDMSWDRLETNSKDRNYPPGSMKRTLSLNGGSFRPGNLIRRLSGSRVRTPADNSQSEYGQPRASHDLSGHAVMDYSSNERGNPHPDDNRNSYFPPMSPSAPGPRPSFRRRLTNLSDMALKAAARGGPNGNVDGQESRRINLQGGLDVALNLEVDQLDPAGITRSYRLLVPALWYEGQGDLNTARFKSRGASMMDRFKGKRHDRDDELSYSGTESDSRGSSVDESTIRHQNREQTNTIPPVRGNGNNLAIPPLQRRQIGNNTGPPSGDTYINPAPMQHNAAAATKQQNMSTQPTSSPQASHFQDRKSQDEPGRSRGGIFGFRRRVNPSRQEYSDYSDDSYSTSGSELSSMELEQQPRRRVGNSKSDRLRGVDNDRSGPYIRGGQSNYEMPEAQSQQGISPNSLAYNSDSKKKKGWKIWK